MKSLSTSQLSLALGRLTVVLAFLAVSASSSGAEPVAIAGPTMGTTYSIQWMPVADVSADDVQALVDQKLKTINQQMSTYDPESELSRLNASTSTDWFAVSPETAKVVERALEVAEISGGAFDPTVGQLVAMWSFGADERSYEAPSDDKLQAALALVGYQQVEVRSDPPAIKKSKPRVKLDLSAIAKGYAVDAVAALLSDQQLTDFLVEIGGEVRTRGTHGGKPWKLGIERPAELRHGLAATVPLTNQALATSGDYRNYFVEGGQRYSHTIDPQTGRPVRHQLASVSIIAGDCMTADAFATAIMVLGPDEGLELANQQKLAAYLLVREGNGFQERYSDLGRDHFQSTLAQNRPGAAQQQNGLLSTFLLALAVFGIAIIGLAAGVIFSNRTLKGSCGGLSAMKDEQGRSICQMCTTPPEECDEFRKAAAKSAAADQENATEG